MPTCLFPIRSQPTAADSEEVGSGSGSGSIILKLPPNDALLPFSQAHRVTVEQVIHAAWALVLRRYVGSDSVTFAVLDSIAATESSSYFTCLMEESSPFLGYMENIKDAIVARPKGFRGELLLLPSIRVSATMVRMKKDTTTGAHQQPTRPISQLAFVVDADFHCGLPKLSLIYGAGIETPVAQNVAATLNKALIEITSLTARPSTSVNEMDLLSERDRQQLRSLNRNYPPAVDSCVHEMIASRARATPDAEAISVVAELAVLKTGSAFVTLDGAHPTDRLKTIVDIAEVSVVLTSAQWVNRFNGLVDAAVCVPTSKVQLEDMFPPAEPHSPTAPMSSVTPDNAAFILFTSGSTGRPKAVVQPHGAICTLFQSHAKSLHVDSSCRVLQFAAYTFDVSTMDIYTTLIRGGCLCIPSEDDRRANLAGFINQTRVNWADLTATVANLLYPHQVPTLKTLVLAGEAVQEEHLERWFGHVRLINCYGPVESGNCTAYEFQDRHTKPAATIGRAMDGARCWIVNPQNPHRLASVGETGEVVVEGPTLSRCYFKDPVRTQAAFVEDLRWSTDGSFTYPGYEGPRRFYRTADMAYLDPDGLLVFVGRSDQQVKVHGQRVELMEIEYHLTTSFPSTITRAVAAYPRSGPLAERLAGVLQPGSAAANGNTLKSQAFGPFRLLESPQIDLTLGSKLPSYMVPSLLLVIERIPQTGSGKSDRKKIHELLCSLPGAIRCSSLAAPDVSPLVPDETLAAAISSFLADLLTLDMIRNRDVPLDRLGIDSIQAMTLLTWLKSEHGAKVSIEHLSKDGVSVRSLAKTVQAAALDDLVLAVDLEKEVRETTERLLQRLRRESSSVIGGIQGSPDFVKNALLTGATGYLGIEMFRQLLLQPTLRYLYVLVQASSEQDGFRRLRQALLATGHRWDSAWDERVVVWTGDLAQPQLGLDQKHWENLTSGRITTIIHNGALVRYNLCYEKLKPVNVSSTTEILRAVCDCPCPINIVYVSGGQRLSPAEESSECVRIRQAANSTGYSQSKLVSELVVSSLANEFASVGGHRLRVVRPGYIIGSPTKGVTNTRDYIWRVVAGAVEAGIMCRSRQNEWIFVCDVEQVAQTVLSSGGIISPANAHIIDDPAEVTTTIMDGIYLAGLWELLSQELRCILRPLHSAQWWPCLRHFVQQQGKGHPLWPLYFFLDQEQGAFTCGWKSDTTAASKMLVAKAIRQNISSLKRTGFLPHPRMNESFRGTGDLPEQSVLV
ncbi:Uu.00g095170.m01.CDS01 [Anthostomella pinea]|uniref:Uu.00g095170.m01.CDS01 n=1 Tax=Anthostomella pinea TaxID=933095 RepID=A0AAI8YMT6_9PEZI|nr:Uu.00g095170.m01.CDS01 [Anthostomella pinea]